MTEPAVRIAGYTHVRELEYRLAGRTALARHDATGDEVIIRYFTAELHADIAYREQVRHQIGQLLTVDTTYLVRVREFVESETISAVVLEAPAAVTLRGLLAYQGVVTAEAALYLLRGSLCGLAAVHAAGVVHRGYRPEVVLVDVDGQVRLLDAGMAGYACGGEVSAVADIHSTIAAFVEFLIGDTTFTKPVDLIAATPVTLRELARFGLSERVDAVALLAMLDRVASEQYGSAWAQRGRLWLAVRATELRLEQLRAEALREQERHEDAARSAALGVLAATVVADAASAAAAAGQVVAREEQRLRSLRAEGLSLRAAWAEELRAAGLPAEVAPMPAVRGEPTAEVAAAGAAGVVTGAAVAGAVRAPAAGGFAERAAHTVEVRRRRRSTRWAVIVGVVVLVLLLGGVAFALMGRSPAPAGGSPTPTSGQGPAVTPAAVPAAVSSPSASPSGSLGPASAASPSLSETWSPAPPFSPVPNQGRG
jgi:hypothetical protein